MSCSMSFNEAWSELSRATVTFGPLVKAAMELWLQATDELPRPLQQPNTTPVTPLIHAALRDAPYPCTSETDNNIAWLVYHLPQISKAMQECVSSQLDIAASRISILQTLAGKEQQPGSTQQSDRTMAEHNNVMLMEVRTLAFFVVLPVAEFCKGIVNADLKMKHALSMQRGRGQQQLLNSKQRGSDLINGVARYLRQSVPVRAQLFKKKMAVQDSLPPRVAGVRPPHGIVSLTVRTTMLGIEAGLVWLKLVTTLPSSHPEVLLFVDHVDWEWLQHRGVLGSQPQLKTLVTQVCLEYGLLSYLWERQPPIARLVLEYLGVYEPDRMQAHGLPTAALPVILAYWQRKAFEKRSNVKPDAVTRSGSRNSQSAGKKRSASSDVKGLGLGLGRSNSARGGDGSSDSAHDNKEQQLQGDEDSNDMQCLLRMMYGYSVKDGQVEV